MKFDGFKINIGDDYKDPNKLLDINGEFTVRKIKCLNEFINKQTEK